jgi:predicted dehydrogenase
MRGLPARVIVVPLIACGEIAALSTSRRESAAASKRFGVPLAFDNHQELVDNDAVDVVAVTVKVPYHLELANAPERPEVESILRTVRGR